MHRVGVSCLGRDKGHSDRFRDVVDSEERMTRCMEGPSGTYPVPQKEFCIMCRGWQTGLLLERLGIKRSKRSGRKGGGGNLRARACRLSEESRG